MRNAVLLALASLVYAVIFGAAVVLFPWWKVLAVAVGLLVLGGIVAVAIASAGHDEYV